MACNSEGSIGHHYRLRLDYHSCSLELLGCNQPQERPLHEGNNDVDGRMVHWYDAVWSYISCLHCLYCVGVLGVMLLLTCWQATSWSSTPERNGASGKIPRNKPCVAPKLKICLLAFVFRKWFWNIQDEFYFWYFLVLNTEIHWVMPTAFRIAAHRHNK